MRAIRRYIVQPVLPEELKPLGDLAHNLRWAWHLPTQELFKSVDPQLWDSTGHDPIKMLGQVSLERLNALAQDRRFVRNVELTKADLEGYLSADLWFQRHARDNEVPRAIAYFSAEFGVSQVLPIYSGGLGILAGDHLKAASDLGVPLIGVGLHYRHGYFRQSLNRDGWQQERYPLLDNSEMPIELLEDTNGEPVTIEVQLRGRALKSRIWVAQVGRIPLLLMDTNVEGNTDDQRGITDKLYGGGVDHRMAQEVLLGIGGVRAVREFCRISGHATPDVFHCNEGHAGFLNLERIREYISAGMDFDTALEHTRAGSVFTTHTPVPAGIDRFPRELIVDQFGSFDGLPLERILALGAEDYAGGDPSRFNMAVMGFRLSQRANGVSQLHGEVSREMFRGLWPAFDVSEVPIGSVTNGVHHRTWIHPQLMELLESDSDSDSVIDGSDWGALQRVEDGQLWALKRQMRADLVTMARERLMKSCQDRGMESDWVADALDPNVLTLGFARRAASYKRLTLMLRDPERLKRLLLDPERPVQIVIAGKAHPADDGGKSLIMQAVQFADQEGIRHRMVFLPDYDISLAQPLYPGCDVWMNNPLRPQEACGTSGMKAALNGAANLSIMDGWWDELYDPRWGWQIPSAEGIADPNARDEAEARMLYDIIENEIAPRFYEKGHGGVPNRWVQMIRDTISGLGPKVLASRMVQDYVVGLYAPASQSVHKMEPAGVAEQFAGWKRRVRAAWPQVQVVHVDSSATSAAVQVGERLDFTAMVRLGELSPNDVEVQLIKGEVKGADDDELENIRIIPVTDYTDAPEGYRRYAVSITAQQTGSIGYTMRVVPKHPLMVSAGALGIATLPG